MDHMTIERPAWLKTSFLGNTPSGPLHCNGYNDSSALDRVQHLEEVLLQEATWGSPLCGLEGVSTEGALVQQDHATTSGQGSVMTSESAERVITFNVDTVSSWDSELDGSEDDQEPMVNTLNRRAVDVLHQRPAGGRAGRQFRRPGTSIQVLTDQLLCNWSTKERVCQLVHKPGQLGNGPEQ